MEDEPFLVRSTGRDQRWREWGVEVAVLGVHSLISVQLSAAVLDPHRDPLGAINLYARKVDTFTAADLERVMVFAAHAGDALATSRLVSGLTEAIESRHLIGIAQGILMARYQLDEPQAFEALQRYSSHSNVKLREVAAQVIEGGRTAGRLWGRRRAILKARPRDGCIPLCGVLASMSVLLHGLMTG